MLQIFYVLTKALLTITGNRQANYDEVTTQLYLVCFVLAVVVVNIVVMVLIFAVVQFGFSLILIFLCDLCVKMLIDLDLNIHPKV